MPWRRYGYHAMNTEPLIAAARLRAATLEGAINFELVGLDERFDSSSTNYHVHHNSPFSGRLLAFTFVDSSLAAWVRLGRYSTTCTFEKGHLSFFHVRG